MARGRRDLNFDEWMQEQRRLNKAPTAGGIRSPVSNLPALAGPNNSSPSGQSQYATNLLGQPPQFIEDVDDTLNWFTPNQPIAPYGPPNIVRPWEWDYPTGYNLSYVQPRMQLMQMLRAMRRSWGVLSTVISTRQDQLLRIPWTIQVKGKPKQSNSSIEKIKAFLKKPDGRRSYSQWARLVTDDLLVLDAPCVYFSRDRLGRPLTAERLDPTTIFPLIDDAGRTPGSIVDVDESGLTYLRRQPAFQQIIKGLPMLDLDDSEILYVPMRPNAEMPIFGYPPTEQILIEAGEAIRKTFYQFNFWAEGSIPDLIVTVPKEWMPRQIAMFQAHFDAMLSGNLGLKSKVRFLPDGMKPFDIKNSSGESLWSQRDETLIRLVCYAYSVSPAPFITMMNRSQSQTVQQAAEEEGLFPLMSFWKSDIMDVIIQKFGFDDLEFVFLSRPEPDGEKQSKIHDLQIKNGLRSRNEIRAERGEEPIEGGDAYLIQTGNAIIPLKDAADGLAMPVQGGDGSQPTPDKKEPSTTRNANQNVPQRSTAKPVHGPSKEAAARIRPSKSDLRGANRRASGDLHSYSSAQLEAGNYKKGHIKVHGLDITIENAPGSIRGKKRNDGSIKWSVKMPTAYGYIKKTEGADGDHVDVYLGKSLDSEIVWIIDQNDVKNDRVSGFDEHKCFIGYRSLEKVLKHFLKTRKDGVLALGPIVELSIDEFKSWLKTGDTLSPIADQFSDRVVYVPNISKLDTISLATNLINNFPQKKKRKKASSGPRWLELSV